MVAETAAQPLAREEPGIAVLVAIPVVFAVLGYGLRLLAYLQAGWEPRLWTYPDGLCRWDCLWYVTLAEQGYDHYPAASLIDNGNWAFFPLFPMLVGGLHALTGWVTIRIATALSILFAGIAALIAWPLLGRSLRAYTLYAAFLLCGPFSIYFTSFYTEVLFVLLTNCTLLALRRGNYLAAGVFGAFVSATRIVGVFIVFAIAAQYLLDYRRRGGTLIGLPRAVWRQPQIVLAILLVPLGTFAYMAYLNWLMGDALAFSHVQRAWGRALGSPLTWLWLGLVQHTNAGWWPSTTQWLALAALTGLALVLVLLWRRRFAEALFSAICLVVPMVEGLSSMLRFVVALSPIMLEAMRLLSARKPVFVVSLLAFVASDYFFTVGWLREWLALV